MEESKQGSWYKKLINDIDSMAETLSLDHEEKELFRNFIMCVARDQYIAGNRSGITWMRSQVAKIGQLSACDQCQSTPCQQE